MTRITKLVVANRGEIARRVARTAKAMGMATVAVFSEPDSDAPFVAEADESVPLGGTTPADSYLRGDRIIAAAKLTGADAVHPGYGFLAESASFAQAVIDAGLVWVGPPPSAIAAMGSKLEAKRIMEEAGVPALPSIDLTGLDEDGMANAAEQIGWPVLVKASAGGGGKGMRVVHGRGDLGEAVEGAAREAGSAFGDATVFLEHYLERARHVEIQVVADGLGAVAHLFERDCSIQRRHQKIIEESPSPAVGSELRSRMGEAATAAARAVGYVSAGTVEFLLHEGQFWFLEMNTRLQVEHPVTEAVTGLDLVRLQLRIAQGEPLPPEVAAAEMLGHAVEARLYAEDPATYFLPATGTLHRFRITHPGVRVDSGVEDGSAVTVYYDPMLAKVIARAPNRTEAVAVLTAALAGAEIHGVTTNRDLLVRVLRHPDFTAGQADTGFLERHDPAELGGPLPTASETSLHAVAAALAVQAERRVEPPVLAGVPSGWRNNPSQPQRVDFDGPHGTVAVGYRFARAGLEVEVDGVSVPGLAVHQVTATWVDIESDGVRRRYRVHRRGRDTWVDGPEGCSHLVEHLRFPDAVAEEIPGSLHAPMPGRVVKVLVAENDPVVAGQALLVLEAMKMEHTLRAPHTGKVISVKAQPEDQVEAAQTLIVVE
ncbi:MAG TPA: biotin carboxylase N-terminal domain-containing protein [Acidimicrobiia bacterium]|nr:biotin carboxylase N-terminal domain-containing protein [Acidimicrobiia bacterium]